MNNVWEFEDYEIYEETDLLRFEDKKGDLLGYVAFNDNKEEIINELNNGTNPIKDGWEDGIGNTLSINGWNL